MATLTTVSGGARKTATASGPPVRTGRRARPVIALIVSVVLSLLLGFGVGWLLSARSHRFTTEVTGTITAITPQGGAFVVNKVHSYAIYPQMPGADNVKEGARVTVTVLDSPGFTEIALDVEPAAGG